MKIEQKFLKNVYYGEIAGHLAKTKWLALFGEPT